MHWPLWIPIDCNQKFPLDVTEIVEKMPGDLKYNLELEKFFPGKFREITNFKLAVYLAGDIQIKLLRCQIISPDSIESIFGNYNIW